MNLHHELPLREVAHRKMLECPPETNIAEAASRMFAARCGSILVVEAGQVVGIWTEHDALAMDFTNPEALQQAIATVMSVPVHTIGEGETLQDAALRLRHGGFRHLLVVDGHGQRVGVVSQTDVVSHQGLDFYVRMRDVGSLIRRASPLVPGDTPMAAAVAKMRECACDALVVEAAGRLGIVTGRDVLRVLSDGQLHLAVGKVATFPLITLAHDASLYQARQLFVARHIRHLGVLDANGALLGLLSYTDILDTIEREYVLELKEVLRQQTQQLQRSRIVLSLANKVAEASQEAIMITDGDGVIRSVNPAFSLITGYSEQEAVGRDSRFLKSGVHDEAFYRQMYGALQRCGVWSGELWNRRKNGESFPESATFTEVRNEDGEVTHYVCVFTDISEQKRARRHLDESEQKFEQQADLMEMILDTLPVMSFVKDEAGRYLVYNELAAAFAGHEKRELIGKTDAEIFPPEAAERFGKDDEKAIASGKILAREERYTDADGAPRHHLVYKRSVRLGRRRLLIGAAIDITDRKRMENLLAAERRALELIAGGAGLPLTLDSICRHVESLIDGAVAVLTLAEQVPAEAADPRAEALRRAASVIVGDVADAAYWPDFCDTLRAEGYQACWAIPVAPPRHRALALLCLYFPAPRRPVPWDEEVTGHACKLAAIAIERSQAADALQRLATTDTLTGLPNRAYFLSRSSAELQRAERFGRSVAALMLDVDHFKRVNDTYGHAVGDKALQHVSRIVARELRGIDLYGRLGGEEFGAVLPESDMAGALLAAERVRRAIEAEPVAIDGELSLPLTLSVGVAVRLDGESIDRLLARADAALYRAKHGGRNRVVPD